MTIHEIKETILDGIEEIRSKGGEPRVLVGRNILVQLKKDFDIHMVKAGRIPPQGGMPRQLYGAPITINENFPNQCEVVSDRD